MSEPTGRWQKLLQDVVDTGNADLVDAALNVMTGGVLSGGALGVKLDTPYIPTTPRAVEAMLQLAGVTGNDIVYDLGCGDGRIVITAAKKMGARGLGIDIDPVRISEARENAVKESVESLVRFEENSLFDADIREATVVTIFLLGRVNPKLRPKLLRDLAPGARVVSNTFEMGDWKPEREVFVEDSMESTPLSNRLLLWVIPERSETSEGPASLQP